MLQLGLRQKIGFLTNKINLAGSFEEAAQDVLEQFGISLILRQRLHSNQQRRQFPNEKEYHTFRRGCLLIEELSEDTAESAILCSPEQGFLDIGPLESVIVVSGAIHGNFFLSNLLTILYGTN